MQRQRVQTNDFPTRGDHLFAYQLYKDKRISYEKYREVWEFYVNVYEVSRITRYHRIQTHLSNKFKRYPTDKEIRDFETNHYD